MALLFAGMVRVAIGFSRIKTGRCCFEGQKPFSPVSGNGTTLNYCRLALISSSRNSEESKRRCIINSTEFQSSNDAMACEVNKLQVQLRIMGVKAQESVLSLRAIRLALRLAVVRLAKRERFERRRRLAAWACRVGHGVNQKDGRQTIKVWKDGKNGRELKRQRKFLRKRRQFLEKIRWSMRRNTSKWIQIREIKLQFEQIRRQEERIASTRARLIRERHELIPQLRHAQDEDVSRFSGFPTYEDRYIVLNLLSKGGFSEVYKGFDLETGEYVALKLHYLVPWWGERKKAVFLRHRQREYMIHKKLKHRNIVTAIGMFEVDSVTYCTVVEYCNGGDLSAYLRRNRTVSERNSVQIIRILVSVLMYLSEAEHRVIHYDLKPQNILFHQGEVRVADFGLSKVLGEGEDGPTREEIEITSPEAGSFWYLPPESYNGGGKKTKISSKVDVWSVGVILYEMLFGRKPFGHGKSWKQVRHQREAVRLQVDFPTGNVSVSENAKEFISACLTKDVGERPSVSELAQHKFLKMDSI